MGFHLRRRLLMSAVIVPAVLLTALQGVTAAAEEGEGAYQQTNLVSDGFVPALNIDTNLKNPWGISASPSSPFWVSDNATGVTTLYANGNIVPLVVTIPPPAGSDATSAPTGTVFNGTADFQVASGKPARFIFATEDGTISGWNPMVNPTNAILEVDKSAGGSVYKGLTSGSVKGKNYLYAANFHDGTVDVFDKNYAPALPGSFRDRRIPAGFAPFNVQNLNGTIYVTYAKQNAAKHDDVGGPGNGFVDAFSTSGKLLARVARRGHLNSPWGLAIAPKGFGEFSGDLLIGNFGDGRINAYSLEKRGSAEFEGTLRDGSGSAIVNDGLWGLRFGNGGAGGPATTLFFTAGINGEKDGLYGSIVSVPESD